MKKERLAADQIVYHALSSVDPSGRVFFMGDALYRGVNSSKKDFYLNLFNKNVIQDLIAKNLLVETEVTHYELDNYPLVLRHHLIPFVSYPHEWCSEMLKDAAIAYLNINLELDRHGLVCYDPRNLNILYSSGKPIYVDFLAIREKSLDLDLANVIRRFKANFLYPLEVAGQGYPELARIWIKERYFVRKEVIKLEHLAFSRQNKTVSGLKAKQIRMIMGLRRNIPTALRSPFKYLSVKYADIRNRNIHSKGRAAFLNLKKRVEHLQLIEPDSSKQKPTQRKCQSLTHQPDWDSRQKLFYNVVHSLLPTSVLHTDINDGWFVKITELIGSDVVAFDEDESCVRDLYLEFKDKNKNVLALAIDWTSPSFDRSNDVLEPVGDRLKCDLVACLDFSRHLACKQNSSFSFDRAINRLASLTKKWLIIEYVPEGQVDSLIPIENQYARKYWVLNQWYSFDTFLDLFAARFRCEAVHSLNSTGSKLILFEKLDSIRL